MKTQVYDSYELMSRAAAEEIAEYMKEKPEAVICFPTGDSPKGTYRALAERKDGKALFAKCTVVGLDEWLGVDPENPGSGTYALKHDFLIPLGIPFAHVKFFNALSDTPEDDCREMDRFVDAAGGFDIMLLGVGRNGHVALNEPGADVNGDCHVQRIAEMTQRVGQKYFSDDQHKSLPYGLTQGIKRMLTAKKLMVLASGSLKADVMGQALNEEPTAEVPVSLLRQAPQLQFFMDKDAAAKVRK